MATERWYTRARIALGTLIEVRLHAAEASVERFEAAFAAIDRVHRAMSAHACDSDVARIARRAHRSVVAVDAQTFAVLRLAKELFDVSNGQFDVTCGARRARGGTFDAIDLIGPRHVHATRPVTIDLGGIAKGFAVDGAVAALKGCGAIRGSVNAGGDLRVFGEGWEPLQVRDPRTASGLLALGTIHECAVATSADYFRSGQSALISREAASPRPFAASITTIARTCALADALTKCVALDRRGAHALLARYDAVALILEPEGTAMQCLATGPVANGFAQLAA